MVRYNIKIGCRSLWRYKGFSFVNLSGLVLGMAACLLIFVFIRYETGYDAFYNKHVYRLCEIQRQEEDGVPTKIAQTRFPAAPALKSEIPGIREFVRIVSGEKVSLQIPGKTTLMATVFGADASFFRVFGLALLNGDTATALKEPGSLVLTQTLAGRIFGKADPMGQVIRHEGRDTVTYRVTGILPDVPRQSHLQFDAIYSLSTEERPGWMKDWIGSWSFTYLQLDEQANPKAMTAAFPVFLQNHLGQPRAAGFRLFLQPLEEIHLYSADVTQDLLNGQKFDGRYMPLLIAVAVFILVLGLINYINLSTARLMTRAKEVGIRKTSGAGWKEIVYQFLTETFLFSIAAFLVAVLLTLILLPFAGRLLQRDLHLSIVHDPLWLLMGVGMIVLTGFAAGLLPAIAMARIRPAAVLKGRQWTSHRSPLRNALVILQFAIAIGLSMAALTVLRQLRFIQQYDLGFNKKAVIVVPVSDADRRKEEGFMRHAKQIPGVENVTGAIRRLGGGIHQIEVVFSGDGGQHRFRCASMYIDYNYLPFYGISLLAGRSFSPEFAADRNSRSHIINETLARQLMVYSSSSDTSVNSLIGKPFRFGYEDSVGTIVGVARDFNFNSLHERVEPLCLTYLHGYYFTDLSIRLDTKNASEAIAQLEKSWKLALPDQPFTWYFLDSYLQELYRSDRLTGIFMAVFTLIAFFISGLGLVGVAAFAIARRTKEIGVRKILGATVNSVVFLLSKDLVKLVFVSIGIALPAAAWVIARWLRGFAYHTIIPWWMFALAAAVALLIAVLTVSLQAARAAAANPVKSIRLD